MKKILVLLAVVWFGAVLQAADADGRFSTAIKTDEFSEAGLSKLTPAELARLDQLIQAYKNGAVGAVTEEKLRAEASAAKAKEEALAAKREAEAAKSEAKAAKTEVEKNKEGFFGGLWAKSKVVLKPGTQIEYEASETTLAGEFNGWRSGTIFTLANGQRWRVVGGSSYVTSPEAGPRKVRVVPGTLGSFFLEIEGVRQKPKVEFAGNVN